MKQINVDLRIYLAKNFGDDLFLKIIANRYPNVLFHACPAVKYDKKLVPKNVIMHDSKKEILLNKILHKLKFYHLDTTSKISRCCDFTLIVGGSIFQQHPTWKYSRGRLEIFHNLNKEYYILTCNFGPYQDAAFLRCHQKVIAGARDVCFRDVDSYKTFSRLPNVRYAADMALSLEQPADDKPTKKVAISVIDLSWRSQLKHLTQYYTNLMVKIAKQYITQGFEVCLMSFSDHEGDPKAVEQIFNKLTKAEQLRTQRYYYDGDVDSTIAKINGCSIVVASRFHANILGFLLRKKVLPVIYSNKTRNLLNDMDFDGQIIDIEGLNQEYVENFEVEPIKSKAKNCDALIKSADEQFLELDKKLKKEAS